MVDECTRRVSAVSRNGHYSIKIADERRVTRETNRSSINFYFRQDLGKCCSAIAAWSTSRTICRQDTCLVWLTWLHAPCGPFSVIFSAAARLRTTLAPAEAPATLTGRHSESEMKVAKGPCSMRKPRSGNGRQGVASVPQSWSLEHYESSEMTFGKGELCAGGEPRFEVNP